MLLCLIVLQNQMQHLKSVSSEILVQLQIGNLHFIHFKNVKKLLEYCPGTDERYT